MGILDGKTAILTGGARGIGLVQARILATEGARVLVGDIHEAEGQDMAEAARADGLDVHFTPLDVTLRESWEACIETCRKTLGLPDILVNNAAVIFPLVPLHERTDEEWDATFAVNLRGVFLGVREILPVFLGASGGSIVNIASTAAIAQAEVQDATYATSKGAIVTLTRNIAAQYAQAGIRCNAVCPGPIDTPMLRSFHDTPEKVAKRCERVPMRRLGLPEDIANAVAFLASDKSRYTTGVIVPVDGGLAVQ